MLICMVPAISLVSYADVVTAPAVGTYEYYEHLWYDDGHLLSFVDLTHMTQDEIVTNSASLELENTDYRIINGKTGFTTTAGLRSYAKIIDGKNEGKYYLITIDGRADGTANGRVMDDYQFTPNAEGFIAIPARPISNNAHGINSGLWLAHAFSAEEVVTPLEKGHESVTQLDDELDYGSADALNSFTVDMVIDYNSTPLRPAGIFLLSAPNIRGTRFDNSTSEELFGDSTNMAKHRTDCYNAFAGYKLSDNSVGTFILGYDGRFGGTILASRYGGAIESGSALHVAYNFNYESPTTFMVSQSALMKTGTWASGTANAPKTTVASSGYPSYGAFVDMSGLIANVPDASYMYYLRVYDCKLTEEQLKQNHFADLCYFYGVDLTLYNQLTRKFKAQVLDRAQAINLGDTQYAKADLEKLFTSVLLDAMPYMYDANEDYSTKVVDSELEKYIDLYYDDGHLMSMLNLHSITDADVVYNADGAQINSARVVLGNKHETGGKLDSYVRILAGKYAGDYYKLGNQGADDKYNLKIEIDSEGFIKYNEAFFSFGTRDTGVMFSNTYDEAMLTSASPKVKAKSSFLYNTDYKQHDGTYGNFTMEGVYRFFDPYYFEGGKTADVFSIVMNAGYHKGFFVVKSGKGNQQITSFYTGSTHGDGTQRECQYNIGESYHYMARVAFTTPMNGFRSIYFYHPKDGVVTTGGGKEPGFDFNLINNDRSKFSAHNQGSKMYFLRFYDVSLTPAQMKQNHFADLCYYYGLKNTDTLLALGSYALTEEFYSAFQQFRVGMCDQAQINSMQAIIDNLAKTVLDKAKLIDGISKNYSLAIANAESSAAAYAKVVEILNGIDAQIQYVSSLVPLNDEGRAMFDQCIRDLEDIKENINLYYLIVGRYNDNVVAVKNIATNLKNASTDEASEAELIANYIALDEKIHYSNEGALNNAQFAVLSEEGSSEIGRIIAVATSVNAQIAFDASDYLEFVGYQVRITDFAAMRALFAVDAEAVAAGYTYSNLSYDIVCLGFVLADASNAKIEVTYDGEFVSTDASGAIIRYTDEWSREADMDAKVAGLDGEEIYSIIKAYDGADTSRLSDEYTKEYKLRAFIVVEGEGTSFVRYLDAVSENAGDTVSIYELSKYASSVESADNLTNDSFITRVVTTVDGKKD